MTDDKPTGEKAETTQVISLEKRRATLEAKQSALSKYLQKLRKRLEGNPNA